LFARLSFQHFEFVADSGM